MNTITVWLLISVGAHYHSTHASVVEYFAGAEECQRVRNLLSATGSSVTSCIQANVARINGAKP